jgi:hypothetical protein
MTIRRCQSIASNFSFEAFRFRPPGNVMCLRLAESAAASPTGHCQSRLVRTETGRTRNAPASLTLHRVRPVSVPESAPFGGFTHCARACRNFSASAMLPTATTRRGRPGHRGRNGAVR